MDAAPLLVRRTGIYKSVLFCDNNLMKRYRIGEIASMTGLTVRTIRYYEELGLLKAGRTGRGQRWYSESDVIYLRRIIELKELGFSLDEISKIIKLKSEDDSGDKRRIELLAAYRAKWSEAAERKKRIEAHMDELSWHIKQLEGAKDSFQQCPGALCAGCRYKKRCSFFKDSEA